MSQQPTDQERPSSARARVLATLAADDVDYSFTYGCGLRVRDHRYEAHTCPECASPVRPGEEPTT